MAREATCDRCGTRINPKMPECRLDLAGSRAVVFDLCEACQSIVRAEFVVIVADWSIRTPTTER